MASPVPSPPAEFLNALLRGSLCGFAALDRDGCYAYVSESLCDLLALRSDALLRRRVADFLWPAHRHALSELLATAGACAPSLEAPYVSVLHAHGDGGGAELAGWRPLEIKACACGDDATYLVIQDARVPANMESRLSNLLLYTSHDLRTPCASIQAASALLRGAAAVASDGQAVSLLRTIDAACAVLLRCVSNLLGVHALQGGGAGAAPTPPAASSQRVFDPRALVERVLATVGALDSVPPRLVLLFDAAAPLPRAARGDDAALAAALLNVTLAALRMGAWHEAVPVRLRVAAQLRARGPPPACDAVTLRVAAAPRTPAGAPPPPPQEAPSEVLLHAVAEAPGRPLTPLEVSALMAPFGLFPADKGGAIGLPLQVARTLARAAGGDLEISAVGDDATALTLSFAVLLPQEGDAAASALSAPGVEEGLLRLLPASWPAGPLPPPPELPPLVAGAPAAAADVTPAMFHHLLANCDDVFAVCAVSPAAAGGGGVLDARITYISPSLAWRMGTEPAAALGRSVLEMCHPEDAGAFHDEMARARAAPGGRLCCTHRGLRADGASVWCRTVGVFAADQLYLVCRDVRPTKTAELALRAFTLAAGHELREPCNTIAVALAVLARRPALAQTPGGAAREPPPDGHDALVHPSELMDAMCASAQLLQGIIGNIITVPQLEAGELALQLSVFSPAALLADVLKICRLAQQGRSPPAHITSVAAGLRGLAPLPPLLEADRDRLAQIIQNLVTNSVKFSAGAPVQVWAGMAPPEAEPGAPPQLVLCVADRGRGMSAAEAAACFRAGVAAPPAAGGGTGLGLTISQMFAELMGGALSVASAPGEGSTFTLRVPARVPSPDDAAALAALDAAAAAARAADDAAAAEQEEARSLAAAAAAAAEVTAGEHATSADSEHPAATPEHPAAPSPRKLRVLVADDHPLALRLVTRLLQLHGFAVTPVADGGAALEALKAAFPARCIGAGAAAAAVAPFDLALLDMDMPVLSGPDVAAAFRAWEAAARPHGHLRLPIAALTANVAAEHTHTCAAAGMALFLAKPLRAADMPLLRAHAASFAEARAVEQDAAAALPQAAAASQAAAAAAASAHQVLGPPACLGRPG